MQDLMNRVEKNHPAQPEFHQAVREVLLCMEPVAERHRFGRDSIGNVLRV